MGLVGAAGFVRSNPRSDRFTVHDFAHVEVWCGDASTTWRRWAHGLGLRLVAKSDHSTGNSTYASYVCRCGFRAARRRSWPCGSHSELTCGRLRAGRTT
jgi:hypothetical protein